MKTFTPSLILIACSATPVFAATYFLPGVSEKGGWHDAEKVCKDPGEPKVDNQMCWAAQAANMTQYWQDWYVKAGNRLPTNAPNGYAAERRSDGFLSSNIFETYKASWSNVGGLAKFGLPWYFTGLPHWEYHARDYDRNPNFSRWNGTNGGYFSDLYPEGGNQFIAQEKFQEHQFENNMYINQFTETLKRLITVEHCVVGLSLQFWENNPMNFVGGHAVTLWGFDTNDASGEVSAIYITDSDDDVFGLVRYAVDGHANLGYDVELPEYLDEEIRAKYDVGIEAFTSLSVGRFVESIPEPSAFGLFAGLGTLSFVGTLRRRKQD